MQDESAADAAGPSKEARLEAAAAEAEAAVARVFQDELGVTVPLEVDALQPAGPMGAPETWSSPALLFVRIDLSQDMATRDL